eukprot:366413-Chlamydomonas_euryale.AAC.13
MAACRCGRWQVWRVWLMAGVASVAGVRCGRVVRRGREGITNGAQWYPVYGGMQVWRVAGGRCGGCLRAVFVPSIQ